MPKTEFVPSPESHEPVRSATTHPVTQTCHPQVKLMLPTSSQSPPLVTFAFYGFRQSTHVSLSPLSLLPGSDPRLGPVKREAQVGHSGGDVHEAAGRFDLESEGEGY